MVQLPTQMLPQLYTQLMEQIKARLDVVREALNTGFDQRADPYAFIHIETALLNVRRITELLALAVLLAHNEHQDFRTSSLMKAWNPDAIFNRLTKLNVEGFPRAVEVGETDSEGVMELFIHDTGYLDRESVCRIYHDCCDRLHAGSLKALMSGVKKYDLGEIQSWAREIKRLLNNHVILLPERQRTMIVFMAVAPDGHVECELHNMIMTEELGSGPLVTRRYRSAHAADVVRPSD